MASNKVDYRPDHRGLQDMLNSRGIQRACIEAAEHGKSWAESNSPRATGEYATSFTVRGETINYEGKPRAGAVLENTADHAAEVEWGQGKHVLGRAVDAVESW